MNKIITLLILSSLLFATSCSKDEENPKAELLSSTAWKIVAGSVGGLEESLSDCDFDDRYYYRSDGTYEYNNGAEKCFSDDPEEITWELAEDGTQIHIVAGGDDQNVDILELTETRLVWETSSFFGTLRQEFEAVE
ncbi:MAG: lipocalin family protein [Chitinophagales bacterium]